MSGTLLNQFARSITFTPDVTVDFTKNDSKQIEIWHTPSHAWMMSYESIPITGIADQRLMSVFINSLKMGVKSFEWLLPVHSTPQGTANINPTVNTTLAGSYDVQLLSLNNSNGLFLLPGDLVRFSNHSKVYQVEEIQSQINPIMTLSSPLVKPLVNSNTVQTSGVTVKTIIDPDSEPVIYGLEAGDMDAVFTIDFIEKI